MDRSGERISSVERLGQPGAKNPGNKIKRRG
jgi:hypothetical protein